MLHVTLRGQEANYSATDGWRSNDALTERYLREFCDPQGKSDSSALEMVRREYGDGCVAMPAPGQPATEEAAPAQKKKSKGAE